MKTQKGFTLIELLVVIAIIGILAGMVVINLSDAPKMAKDSKIQSYIDQMRTAAALFNATNNTYVGFDLSGEGETIKNNITGIGTAYNSFSTAIDYCAKARMIKNTSEYWCTDSTGFSGTTTADYCIDSMITCLPPPAL